MASDAVRRFLGTPRQAPVEQPQPAIIEAGPSAMPRSAAAAPRAAQVGSADADPFSLLEAQFGKQIADKARAQVAELTSAAVPTTSTIPAGIGESLMHMKITPHKADVTKVVSANRRFMPDKFAKNDGLTPG